MAADTAAKANRTAAPTAKATRNILIRWPWAPAMDVRRPGRSTRITPMNPRSVLAFRSKASARASCQAAIARACSRKVSSAAALYLDSLSGAWAGCRVVRQGHFIGPQGIRHPRQRLSLSRTIPGRAGAVGVALATDTSGHQGPTRLVELGLDHIVQPQSRISLPSAVPFNLGMPRTPCDGEWSALGARLGHGPADNSGYERSVPDTPCLRFTWGNAGCQRICQRRLKTDPFAAGENGPLVGRGSSVVAVGTRPRSRSLRR
jgi:hypothetical protein